MFNAMTRVYDELNIKSVRRGTDMYQMVVAYDGNTTSLIFKNKDLWYRHTTHGIRVSVVTEDMVKFIDYKLKK